MRKFLLVVSMTTCLLTPSEGQMEQSIGRLNKLDRQMRRLNLTEIHFSDPSGIVGVDTVVNVYRPPKEDLIERLKQKVNETAEMMANTLDEQRGMWIKKVINVPLPNDIPTP